MATHTFTLTEEQEAGYADWLAMQNARRLLDNQSSISSIDELFQLGHANEGAQYYAQMQERRKQQKVAAIMQAMEEHAGDADAGAKAIRAIIAPDTKA